MTSRQHSLQIWFAVQWQQGKTMQLTQAQVNDRCLQFHVCLQSSLLFATLLHNTGVVAALFLWARGPLQFLAVGWVPAAGQETITI